MARSRKRYDIYSQPGLFDSFNEPLSFLDNEWVEGKIVAAGGNITEPQENIPITVIPPTDNRLRFMSFGSGSSGNCAYIGCKEYGILVDAGIERSQVEYELHRNGIELDNVMGILVTHDHYDHVSNAYNILRRHRHMALFCTPKTLGGMLRRHGTSRRIKEYHHPIYKEAPFNIKQFRITPFEVFHDGSDNVGYFIEYRHHRFVVATDMGIIGERADYYMRQATSLMVESDYDYDMLVKGHYPRDLKARIIASKGHLDNTQTATFLQSAWNPSMTHIFLCHLSKDNNTPMLATSVIKKALLEAGASTVGDASESLQCRDAPVQLYALPRYNASPIFYII